MGYNKLVKHDVKFDVSTAAKIMIVFFWVVTHCVHTFLRTLLPLASGSVRRRQHIHTKETVCLFVFLTSQPIVVVFSTAR